MTERLSTLELTREHHAGREEHVAALFAAIDQDGGPDPDYDGQSLDADEAQTRLDELPLGIEVRRVLRVELSTGGPADWIEAELDDTGAVQSARFHFADWGTHESRSIAEDSALWRLAEQYAEAVPA